MPYCRSAHMLWEDTLPSGPCCDVQPLAWGLVQSGFFILVLYLYRKLQSFRFFPFICTRDLIALNFWELKSYGFVLYLSINLYIKLFIYRHVCVRCVMCINGYLCVYVILCTQSILQMKFKYGQDTNQKHNLLVKQLLFFNVFRCVSMKHVQKTFPKAEIFGMYKGVGDSRWCRLGLTDVQLTMNLIKP